MTVLVVAIRHLKSAQNELRNVLKPNRRNGITIISLSSKLYVMMIVLLAFPNGNASISPHCCLTNFPLKISLGKVLPFSSSTELLSYFFKFQ